MQGRERALKEVISALKSLDDDCLQRRDRYKQAKEFKEAMCMEQIRKGINISIDRVEKMLSGKIEVIF